jgi:large subunit ribosomal protein L25
MSQQFKLNVADRAQTGRSASRRLRKANRVPAILYGKHTKPESLSIEGPEFIRLLKSVGDRAVLIELQRDGAANKALSFLQEVQRDPITDKYVHVQHQLRIRVLPKDLPEAITIDVTELKVGETLKVGSIKPIAGVEFLDPKGQPVVSCVEPVAEIVQEVAAAPSAAEGAAAAAAAGAAPAEGAAAAPAAGAAAAPAAGAAAKPGAAPAGAKPAAGAAAKPAAPAKK